MGPSVAVENRAEQGAATLLPPEVAPAALPAILEINYYHAEEKHLTGKLNVNLVRLKKAPKM